MRLSHLGSTIFVFGFLFTNLYSQTHFREHGVITVTFPTREETGDTVSLSRIRIAGHLSDSGRIWINGEEKLVYPSLAFVGLAPLKPGDNQIMIVGETIAACDTMIIPLYRVPLLPELPEQPTIITGDFIQPGQNQEFYQPTVLHLRFRGSPGGVAEARIPGLEKHIPMTEVEPERGMGMHGIYEGEYLVPAGKTVKNKPIEFRLRGKDGKLKKLKTKSFVTVYPATNWLMAETVGDENLINTRPNGTLLLSLPPGIRLNVVAKLGSFYQVRLADDLTGFIRSDNLQILPAGTPRLQATIGGIRIWQENEWLNVDLSISDFCPFQVEQSLSPRQLILTVFSAAQTSQWLTYPYPNNNLDLVQWRQVANDRYQLQVNLNQDHWGYKIRYMDHTLRLSIRKPPVFGDNPFANLVFAVDAGHGGTELGAVGATGLLEKDVDLMYATYLRDLLIQAGAKAYLTREKDTTMTLRSRIEKAEKMGAHIFVWCHNNSLGEASDPLLVRGTSTYYTQPMGKRLADLVLPHLLDLGLQNFGEIQSLYYVTRQTGLVTFLVEGGFMSHPEDEMLLMYDMFLHRLAVAVFLGIQDFLLEEKAKSN